jgi:hypothetical protein
MLCARQNNNNDDNNNNKTVIKNENYQWQKLNKKLNLNMRQRKICKTEIILSIADICFP